jgi:hypothetical protein
MTSSSQHLCPGIGTITVSTEGDNVFMHVGKDVTGAPGCIEVGMCGEFALLLAADLQFQTAYALAPLFPTREDLKKFIEEMNDDARQEIIKRERRRRNDAK